MRDSGGRSVFESGTITPAGLIQGNDNDADPLTFDKTTATDWVKVVGGALQDPNFNDTGDDVRYSVDVGSRAGPFNVEVEVRFQPIGYRWAHNVEAYDAFEPKRFVGDHNATSADASVIVASARAEMP